MNAVNYQPERSKLPVAIRLLLGYYEVAINLLRRMQANEGQEEGSEISYIMLLPKYFN